MLEDFVYDLLTDLKKRHENELSKLVSASSGDRHDLIRGRVQATEEAMRVAQGLYDSYARKEAA